jgi:hypothetical protein
VTKVSRELKLGVSMASCVRLLSDDPESILGSEAASLSIEVLGFELKHPIRLVVGELTVVQRPIEVVSLPFHVEADGGEGWFPVFEADLEVVGGHRGVSVALDGSYRPPGGPLGAIADLVALHRVADDAIDRYFGGITARLGAQAADLDALSGVPI